MHLHKRYTYPHTTADGSDVNIIACTRCGMEWNKERTMIPLPNLSLQTRHGRDVRPHKRPVYIIFVSFWATVTAIYGHDLANNSYMGPAWLNWTGLVTSALFLLAYLRILIQYKGRTAEWTTTVRTRNAAVRGMKGGQL